VESGVIEVIIESQEFPELREGELLPTLDIRIMQSLQEIG
jgi:hypothetical protein